MAEQHYDTYGKSDLTLTSDSDEYYVHQVVCSSQSPVLKAKCAAVQNENPNMLSRLTKLLTFWHQDPGIPTIDVSGYDDVALDAMIHFFYHGNYYPNKYEADTTGFDRDVKFHATVLRVARFYKVKKLESMAGELMERAKFLLNAERADEIEVLR